MFNKGVRYVSKVLDGESRTNSIMFAFDISKDRARSKASDFHRRKWVQEVLRYLSPDEGTLYIGEVDTVIKTAMEMIRDPRRDDRVKIEAIKAVQPFIKQMVQREETNIKITAEANPAEAVMTQMVDAVKQLTANGKMINQKGEIIDVETVQ
ncbi:MAG: hypothetical protein K0U20_09365 [Proteobacteria bacterium]|nr:hypothetical protein [Pseudomonadota bacterium]